MTENKLQSELSPAMNPPNKDYMVELQLRIAQQNMNDAFAKRVLEMACEYGWSGDLVEIEWFVKWIHDKLDVPYDPTPIQNVEC